jgi:DNA-binding GntR family transcriptional regulator
MRDPPSVVPTRQTARDVVAEYVQSAILSGRFKPSERLRVAELADVVGVSHTPTREALQMLASKGLVRINAYRGAFVAELSADEYEEITLMRLPLEGLAARLGAERITPDQLEEMRRCLEDLERAAAEDDIEAFLGVDRAFHQAHYLASRRQSLWDRIIALRLSAERYTRLGYSLPGVGMEETAARHRILFDVTAQHDGAAAEREITADLRMSFETIWAEVKRGSAQESVQQG